jgi:beta-phosphoglucomutase
MTPGAIVFDFDGVLVDSEPAHGRGLEVAAASLGMSVREANPRWYVGLGDRECFQRIAAGNGRELSSDEMARLIRLKAEEFSRASQQGFVVPYPGAVELVRDVAGQRPTGLCSGSHARDIVPLLDRLGIRACFRTLVTADDVSRNKPDPEGYRLAAARLGMTPEACTTIEDSPAGIAAARGAGYRVIGVLHSFPRERLVGAHEICGTIAEARGLLLGE